jgi:adenylosuccinate lyase
VPKDPRSEYQNPLITRYASREMAALFSERARITAWREVWVALAECQRELGLPITQEQVDALREHVADIDFDAAAAEEGRRRHDVMAHVHAYGLAAPVAKPVIHLGATSCDVTDNADLVLTRRALRILERRLVAVLQALAAFARAHRALPCLGATHLQPAQPTTVGKRATLWAQDFLWDLREIRRVAETLPLRGVKGTTGTQASFLELLGGDHDKVRRLDQAVARRLGFERTTAVTGQTYPRKLDTRVVSAVAGMGESAGKLSSDVRLLQGLGELAEPFAAEQTGSSAMPYKRNPMRCERMASLSRVLLGLPAFAAQTSSTQWLERSLDDSALRRLVLPEAFLLADAVLVLALDVARGLELFPQVVRRRLMAELPFMASEVLLAEGVKAGGDRQDLHEAIRAHAHEAARRVREEGAENDLLERLAGDRRFAPVAALLPGLRDPDRFIGRAAEQVDEFLEGELDPELARATRGRVDDGHGEEPTVRV